MLVKKSGKQSLKKRNSKESHHNVASGSEDADQQEKQLAHQLGKMGLKLRDVPGDGNCLFRALGDQLEGNQLNHIKHRRATVNYMVQQRNDFEPFIEDDMTFDDYVNDLNMDGTYAGNDAIVAFARNNQVDIIIHQLNAPVWTINGGRKGVPRRQLHIAYLHGDHYLSVRQQNDNDDKPTNIMLQKSSKSSASKLKSARKEEIRRVQRATGIKDEKRIQEMLDDCDNNVEYAISTLLQMEDVSSSPKQTKSLHHQKEDKKANSAVVTTSTSSSSSRTSKKENKREKKARATERRIATASTSSILALRRRTNRSNHDHHHQQHHHHHDSDSDSDAVDKLKFLKI